MLVGLDKFCEIILRIHIVPHRQCVDRAVSPADLNTGFFIDLVRAPGDVFKDCV